MYDELIYDNIYFYRLMLENVYYNEAIIIRKIKEYLINLNYNNDNINNNDYDNNNNNNHYKAVQF